MKGLCLGLFAVLLMGCTPSISASPDPAASQIAQPVTPAGQAQALPLTAQVKVGNQVILLEEAKTPEQQEIGLMYRTELAGDRGMAFPFQPARKVGFWMKNMDMSIDMVFVHAGKVVTISAQVPACKTDPCAIYAPNSIIDQVVELRSGRAAELGLKVGDRFLVEPRQ